MPMVYVSHVSHGGALTCARVGAYVSYLSLTCLLPGENTFEFLEHTNVAIAVELNAACGDEPSRAHFGRGAQVGLAVALRHIRSGQAVIAVTTHLSCNFQEPWTQVAQIQTVLSAAAALREKHGGDTTPVVLGADLNSIPGSGVYHLVAGGHVPASHPHLKIIAEHVDFPEFENGGGGGGGDVRQPIDFGGKSTYAAILGQEPLFTNFTPGFVGCLDYIFASKDSLTPLQILVLPPEDHVRKEGFLPASHFPSDHVSLFARFAISTPAAIAATKSPPMNRTAGAIPPPAALAAPMLPPTHEGDEATLMPPRDETSLMPPPALPPQVRPPRGASVEPSPSKRCRGSADAHHAFSAAASSAASSTASSAVSSPVGVGRAAALAEAADASVAALDAVHLGGTSREGRTGARNSSESYGSSNSPQEGQHRAPRRGTGGRGGGGSAGGGSRRSGRR